MTRLSVRDVEFDYRGAWSLGPISLEIEDGEILAIVGPNGSGKTTLLDLFAGLKSPRCGVVTVDERDLQRLSAREIAIEIGYASQEQRSPLALSLEESVALGRAAHRGWFAPLTATDWQSIDRAIETMGLQSHRSQRSNELSTGEHRRMVIARALAQEPKAMLLDEPTAHLDLRYQASLLALLDQLAHRDGAAVAVTLHDLNEAARVADRVVLLDDGRLVAVGRPAEVLTPANIERAYAIRVDIREHPHSRRPWIVPLSGEGALPDRGDPLDPPSERH